MANYNWYKASYRRSLLDMHVEDWNGEFLSRFDARTYVSCLKRGHVQSPIVCLQSQVGLCNWPTRTARTHRAFAGNKIKELIDLCHAEGMDAIGYYSLIFNNWAYENHAAWRMKDKDGKSSRENGAGQYGKGTVIWSAASFEASRAESHKDVFLRLVQSLYGGESMLSSTAASSVHFTLFDDKEQRRFLLHAVNVQERMPYIKVGDFSVSLKTDRSVRSVKLLPGSTEVKSVYKAGLLTFDVNDMELFRMYELQY